MKQVTGLINTAQNAKYFTYKQINMHVCKALYFLVLLLVQNTDAPCCSGLRLNKVPLQLDNLIKLIMKKFWQQVCTVEVIWFLSITQ